MKHILSFFDKKISFLENTSFFQKVFSFLDEDVSFFRLKDFIVVFLIAFLYGLISFYRLGDIKSPKTFYRLDKGEEIVFEFEEPVKFFHIFYFNGERNSKFRLYVSDDNVSYRFVQNVNPDGAFTWNDIHTIHDAKYVKLRVMEDSSLGEVAFYAQYHKLLPYSTNNFYLMDEVDLVPSKISYMNSTYFDEIYFATTGYQMENHLPQYEWTHPPLGKVIQAIPFFLTHSFSPFLYRFMGNLSGILLLVVLYFFGAILFRKRGYAILSSLFMGLDTFHFVQTRMGTVDSHLVLFITLATMFMILYVKQDKTRYLFLSGLFFGCSVAVKWTGFYAGIGLAIVYFIHFICKKKDILESIVKGCIFFVVMPLILYCSIYFLFPNNLHKTNSLENIIEEQKSMFTYHSTLKADHFFSSPWYSWPISYKPIWYHEQDFEDGTKETISGLGNLVLWYVGIIAFFYSFVKMIWKKDINSFYLVVFALSLWLPYAFIHRVMFLYHYFPVLPFLFLMIVSFLKDLTEKFKLKALIPVYVLFVFTFFVIYYPVISGMTVSEDYVSKLKLFDSWYF